jgi:hypothetical protein
VTIQEEICFIGEPDGIETSRIVLQQRTTLLAKA